jgi:hypothetical protein
MTLWERPMALTGVPSKRLVTTPQFNTVSSTPPQFQLVEVHSGQVIPLSLLLLMKLMGCCQLGKS